MLWQNIWQKQHKERLMVWGANSSRQGGHDNKHMGKWGLQSRIRKKWVLVLSSLSPYSVWELSCKMMPPSSRVGPLSSHKLFWKHHNRYAQRVCPQRGSTYPQVNNREMDQLVKHSPHMQEVQSSGPQGPNKKTCVQCHVSVIWTLGRMVKERIPKLAVQLL